jgi:hypothetical protein
MKYDVILFVPVKVKFINIEAASQIEAAKLADKALVIDKVIKPQYVARGAPGITEDRVIQYVEAEDEVSRALVDEEGDENYERSQFYTYELGGTWVPEHFTHVKSGYEKTCSFISLTDIVPRKWLRESWFCEQISFKAPDNNRSLITASDFATHCQQRLDDSPKVKKFLKKVRALGEMYIDLES